MAEYKRVELNADDIIGEATKSLADYVAEARKVALQEQIKANTILIDEKFAKVNNLHFCWGRTIMDLPPMICGLEIYLTDELPDGYNFALIEAPETERERIFRQAKSEAAKEIFEEIENILYKFAYPSLTAIGTVNVLTAEGFHIRNSDYNALKKKYTE